MNEQLGRYLAEFANLKPNRSMGRSSPHKASLMLAVIDLIEQGVIDSPRICFNPRLKDAFAERFDTFSTAKDKRDASQPFFYLSSSSFWTLVPNAGKESELEISLERRRHGSGRQVKQNIAHAELDAALFALLQNDIARAQLALVLESSLQTTQERFGDWVSSLGKSSDTVSRYLSELGMISSQLGGTDIFSLTKGRDVQRLIEHHIPYSAYEVKDLPVDSVSALELYKHFLEQESGELVESDILLIQQDEGLTQTEKTVLVNARRGQGTYRQRILAAWQYRCSVTQYPNTQLLVASHIRPWRKSNNQQRLDRLNGLLLIPNLDRAFDLGLISFNGAGQIMISDGLERPEVLGIDEQMRIDIKPQAQPYMDYHRGEIFGRRC